MKKNFFTLVELLVVIAIIAVLSGLLFPVISSALAASDKTQCVSNQKQTAQMLNDAMSSNGGFLVSATKNVTEMPSGSGPSTTIEMNWASYLYCTQRLSDMKAFRCPSASGMIEETDPSKNSEALSYCFGVADTTSQSNKLKNGDKFFSLDFNGTKSMTTSDSRVISPSQLLLGGDYTAGKPNIESDGTIALQNWHNGETNIFCLDGHAQTITHKTGELKFYLPTNSEAKALSLK